MLIVSSESLTKSVFTPEYTQFAARIGEMRKNAGLTQAEVAQRLGRPQSYVSKYERGERRLDIIEFLAVAHALGVEATSLIAELQQLKGTPDSGLPATRQHGRTHGSPQGRK